MGEMLWSAVRRGGLLDERWWECWIGGVQHETDLEGHALWVTMRPGPKSHAAHPRRWRADPVTRMLILNWHRDGLVLALGIAPRDCIALFRRGLPDAADQLVGEARRLCPRPALRPPLRFDFLEILAQSSNTLLVVQS